MSAHRRYRLQRAVLFSCPLVIGLLWIAGVARFRGYVLAPMEWAGVCLAGVVMHLTMAHLTRRRPLPALPPGQHPALISLFAAALVGTLAALAGVALELTIDHYRPSTVAMPWRVTWHAACAFGALYCSFLHRLLGPSAPPPATRR